MHSSNSSRGLLSVIPALLILWSHAALITPFCLMLSTFPTPQCALTLLPTPPLPPQGSCKVNESIELPELKLSRPIKSIHMFHKPVNSIARGDRAGICVTQLNPKLVERGLAAAPGCVQTFSAAVAAVDKVRFYAAAVPSKQKYHAIVGHATVMAEATFFGLPDGQGMSQTGKEIQPLRTMSCRLSIVQRPTKCVKTCTMMPCLKSTGSAQGSLKKTDAMSQCTQCYEFAVVRFWHVA